MIQIRRSAERGYFDFGWLKTRHTFSFDRYYDPNYMGFRSLRVINQDIVAPNEGFATHYHRNMEILTFVISGAVIHKDSMGSETIIRPGEIQRMSAGRGVSHSEYNYSNTDPLELLQIWILPEDTNLEPSYEQKKYHRPNNNLILLASPTGENNSVIIHQQSSLSLGSLTAEHKLITNLPLGHYAWLQMITGIINMNGHELFAGDGAAITNETVLALNAIESAEFLLFDLV